MRYEFIYYDIETYDPSGLNEADPGPHFWYGVAQTSDGDSHRFTDAHQMWLWLVDRQSTDTVVFAVAHNGLGYDAPQLAFEVERVDPEWNTRAGKKTRGGKRVHRLSTHNWEVYARDYTDDGTTALQPVVLVDSKHLLTGALASWGESLGMDKGDTPIAHTWREVTDEDWDYCERDVDILRVAFQRRGGEQLLPQGIMTTSADSRAGYKARMGARKRSFSVERRAKADTSLPPRVEEQVQADHTTYRTVWRNAHPTYGKHDYANRKALRKLREAHRDALGVKAQRLMQRRANTPGIPLTDKQQAVWNAIQPIEGVGEQIIKNGVVPYSRDGEGTYTDPKYNYRRANKDVRPALRGGITRPFHHCGSIINDVIVLDVNSLYPWIMRNHPIYAKYALRTDGETPIEDVGGHTMWIGEVDIVARVKDGRHATVKRHSDFDDTYNDHINWTGAWITQPDFDTLREDYIISHVQFHTVHYFVEDKELTEAIDEHLDELLEELAKHPRGSVEYLSTKLRRNSIWGRLAMLVKMVEKEGEKVDIGDKDAPVGAAALITALARKHLADTMRPLSDHVVYADTDSLHLCAITLDELHEFVDIDPRRQGAWKVEAQVARARYLNPKTYIHEYEDGHTELTTAGVHLHHKGYGPDAVSVDDEQISVEEFVGGFVGTTTRGRELEDGRVQIGEARHRVGDPKYPTTRPHSRLGDCREGQGA